MRVSVDGCKGPGVEHRCCRRSIRREMNDGVEDPQDRSLIALRCQDGRPGVAVVVAVAVVGVGVVTEAAAVGTVAAVEIGLH